MGNAPSAEKNGLPDWRMDACVTELKGREAEENSRL